MHILLSHITLVTVIALTLLSTTITRQVVFAKTQTIRDSNFDNLYTNPGAYVNSQANITAKVYNIPSYEIGHKKILQVYQGGHNDTNVLVGYNYTGIRFSSDDCVRIIGTTGNTIEYRTLLGGNLTALPIKAQSVEKIDCMFVYEPPKKTIMVERTQEKQGRILGYEYKSIFDS